jgi:hypothetical protein
VSFSSCRTSRPRARLSSKECSDLQLGLWKRGIPRLCSGQEVSRIIYNCQLLLKPSRNSTVGDVARKVMGDVPISYIEGVGGTRVSEDDIVAVGKHDVSQIMLTSIISNVLMIFLI